MQMVYGADTEISLSQFALPLEMMPEDITQKVKDVVYTEDGTNKVFGVIQKMMELHPNEMPTPVVVPSDNWVNSFRGLLNEELGSAAGDAGEAMGENVEPGAVDGDAGSADDEPPVQPPPEPVTPPIAEDPTPPESPLAYPSETSTEEPTSVHPDEDTPAEVTIIEPEPYVPSIPVSSEWYRNSGVWVGVAGGVAVLGIISYFIFRRR